VTLALYFRKLLKTTSFFALNGSRGVQLVFLSDAMNPSFANSKCMFPGSLCC